MDNTRDRGYYAGNDNRPSQRKKRSAFTLVELLVVIGIIVVLLALLLPSVRTAREPARRNQCMNNLKQIAIAIDHYREAHGALPPAYTTDADGEPLHSWRTLILPFLEEQQVYETIDHATRWDAATNAEASKRIIFAYQCPSRLDGNRTNYLAVVTPESCFRATEPRNPLDVTDGDSRTLMLIETNIERAVPWMSPTDANEDVVLGIGAQGNKGPHPGGMHGVFVDGRVQFISFDMPASQLRALISIAGNDNDEPEAP